MGFVVVFRRNCTDYTKHTNSKLLFSYKIFNSTDLHCSQYIICPPAPCLRLPLHLRVSSSYLRGRTYPIGVGETGKPALPLRALHFVAVILRRLTPTFTACSTDVCDALPCGRLYSYIRFCTSASALQHAKHTKHTSMLSMPPAHHTVPLLPI